MKRTAAAALMALVFSLGLAGCRFESYDTSDRYYGGTPAEQGAIERHERAEDAAGTMLVLLVALTPVVVVSVVTYAVTAKSRRGA